GIIGEEPGKFSQCQTVVSICHETARRKDQLDMRGLSQAAAINSDSEAGTAKSSRIALYLSIGSAKHRNIADRQGAGVPRPISNHPFVSGLQTIGDFASECLGLLFILAC